MNPRTTRSETTRALTEREVADMLGLSVATLRAWRHREKRPRFLRLGRSVRYLPADVADFVRASAVLPAHDRARRRTAEPRQETLRRPAALGDHGDGDRGVPAHAARGRHRK